MKKLEVLKILRRAIVHGDSAADIRRAWRTFMYDTNNLKTDTRVDILFDFNDLPCHIFEFL